MKVKIISLLVAMTFVALFFISKGVMTQVQSYHLFADTRTLLGIPNAMDVLSNLAFLFTGLLGIREVLGSTISTSRSWFWFFISIFLIAPGSAYYHWAPDDFTLIWDRLPMSMGFMALYVCLISEHIDLRLMKLLPVSLFLGMLSILVWVLTSDLRFYFIVQFSSFITIPLILILFPSRYTGKVYYLGALLLYGLAKWTEVKDREIFEATDYVISGHSLKHILAAAGLLLLWWMIRVRRPVHTLTTAS
jgi:Ceramidase